MGVALCHRELEAHAVNINSVSNKLEYEESEKLSLIMNVLKGHGHR
jgi:hypothetical protein